MPALLAFGNDEIDEERPPEILGNDEIDEERPEILRD
jgi:hypothetical protein